MARTRKQKARPRSRMGRILPPVDITSSSMLSALDERIAAGPLTLVFVYADWCGHCQRFKPEMDKLENVAGRTIQTARVRDDVFPSSSLNRLPIEGYPSVLLVDTNGSAVQFKDEAGEVSNTIPDYKNATLMNSIVKNAGTPSMLNAIQTKTATQEGISPETIATRESANLGSPGRTPYPSSASTNSVLPPSTLANRVAVENKQAILNTVSGTSSPMSTNVEHSSHKLIGGSLLQFLKEAAYATGPAIGLVALATQVKGRRRRTSKRKGGPRRKKTMRSRGRRRQ